jgi:hypothetical protein
MAMAGGVGLCSAQDLAKTDRMAEDTGAEMLQEASPWQVSGGLVYKNWLYEHDALQQRVPASSDKANEWEEGDTDGSGWGLQARIGRGDGRLNVIFMKSDFEYSLSPPDAPEGVLQQIDTVSRDFELSWSQIRGRNNEAEWGSTLGFRYLGMQKNVHVTEGEMKVDGSGNMNWLMLLGGYDANWRPFDTPTFQMHGLLHFFLGEVDGTARSGTDEDWTDGVVSETYGNEYSLAYGARASFGVDVALTKKVRMTVDYMREWLYSFDATDTGIVVFPDNSDALFIENHHAVVMSVNYLF